jgi:DNA-binding NtrC family response regulator
MDWMDGAPAVVCALRKWKCFRAFGASDIRTELPFLAEKAQIHFVTRNSIFYRSGIVNSPTPILVVSAELENRRALASILNREGWDTVCASKVTECQEALHNTPVNLVFCDRRLTDGSYRDVLAITRNLNRKVRVIVTSRLADWDEYLEALHHGAFDLIASPCQPTDVVWAIIQAKREDQETAAFVAPAANKARSAVAGQLTA